MKTSQPKQQTPNVDRPLIKPEEDELGFVETARKLAPSVLHALNADGVVIGIEGEWGSGKTTLANYLLAEVKRQASDSIELIYLSPWLNGDADTLVGSLLQAIASIVENRSIKDGFTEDEGMRNWRTALSNRGRKVGRWFRKKRRTPLTKKLSKYARKTARTISPLSTVGDILFPGAGAVGKVIGAVNNAFASVVEAPTTVELKDQIAIQLKDVDCRFVVLIDDLDRLEPSLAVEVVRLVRSVADFPNILYVMCYDRAVLAHALEAGLEVDDGYRFLRKIVQQTFSMPLPEPFDLRLMLIDKAIAFFGGIHKREPTEQERSEIRDAINEWGEGLRTPRDVKLVLNGVAFAYPPTAENVYYPDICRLHVIKVAYPLVYEWLENYLSEYSVIATGDGQVGHHGRASIAQKLREIFPEEDDPQSPQSAWRIQQMVPGVDVFGQHPDDETVFRQVTADMLVNFSRDKRLGSPYHYRYYFALSGPRTVLSDTDVEALLIAASDGNEAIQEALRALYDRPRRLGGNWLYQLLDRLSGTFLCSLNVRQLDGLLLGIASLMDYALDREPTGFMFRRTLAERSSTAIGRLYREWRRRELLAADDALISLLTTTPSVNWLVGYLFRREMFDHGCVDPARAKPPETWLMSADVYERALPVIQRRAAQRAAQASFDQLPDLSSFVFGWRELSGPEIVRQWIAEQTREDGDFVGFLLRMRGWAVSDHVFRPLDRRSLIDLMEVDMVQSRLEAIRDGQAAAALQNQATKVLEALALGERHR